MTGDFLCDQQNCGHTSVTPGALRKHYHDTHPERKDAKKELHAVQSAVVCPYCGHGYNSNSKMFEHIRSKRAANDQQHNEKEGIVDPLPKKALVQVDRLFNCPQCKAGFTQSSALNRHLKGRCQNMNLAVPNVRPQPGIERVVPFGMQQELPVAAAGSIRGQYEASSQDASQNKNQEEEKKENLVNQCVTQPMEALPPISDAEQSSNNHHQGGHQITHSMISSQIGGIEIPKDGRPLIGSNLITNTFNNDQQDHQRALNFDVSNEVLLNNSNNSHVICAAGAPAIYQDGGANNNALPEVEGLQLQELLNNVYQSGAGYNHFDDEDDFESDLSVPRSVHEHKLARETLSEKFKMSDIRYSPAGSFKSGTSSSGKRKTLVVRKPQRKWTVVCGGDNQASEEAAVHFAPVSPSLVVQSPVEQDKPMEEVESHQVPRSLLSEMRNSSSNNILMEEIKEEDIVMDHNNDDDDKIITTSAVATKSKGKKPKPKKKKAAKNKKRSATAMALPATQEIEQEIRSQVEVPPEVRELYQIMQSHSNCQWGLEQMTSADDKGPARSTRSQCDKEKTVEEQQAFQLFKDSQACVGYGEITSHSMQSMIRLLQNRHPTKDLDYSVVSPFGRYPQYYYLDDQSSFLDIGSGFGMAVWHTFAVAACLSIGLEIQPNRLDFATQSFALLDRFAEDPNLREVVADARNRNRVLFTREDAASGSGGVTGTDNAFPYVTVEGSHFSHIFSFNLVFSPVDLLNIAERLNTTNFRVLVWCSDMYQTQKKLGIRDVVFLGAFNSSYSGGKAKFYIYAKVPPASQQEVPPQQQELQEITSQQQETRVDDMLKTRTQRPQQQQQLSPPQQCPICHSGFADAEELCTHAAKCGDTQESRYLPQQEQEEEEVKIPCELCHTLIPFSLYDTHGKIHLNIESQRQQHQQEQHSLSISPNQEPDQFDRNYAGHERLKLQSALLNMPSASLLKERRQIQRDALARKPPPLSWKERNDLSNIPLVDTLSRGQQRHLNPTRFPPAYQPGIVSFTKREFAYLNILIVKAPALPNASNRPLHNSLSLQDTINKAYDFSSMTTEPLTKAEIKDKKKKGLNRSDMRYLPVANISSADIEQALAENGEKPYCFVCYVTYLEGQQILVLRCGHHSCIQCLTKYLVDNSYECPVCKHPQMKISVLDLTLQERTDERERRRKQQEKKK